MTTKRPRTVIVDARSGKTRSIKELVLAMDEARSVSDFCRCNDFDYRTLRALVARSNSKMLERSYQQLKQKGKKLRGNRRQKIVPSLLKERVGQKVRPSKGTATELLQMTSDKQLSHLVDKRLKDV